MKRKKLKADRAPMPPATTYGSVCSGIEAATVAWGPLGMKAAWFSEIEAYPCSVLKHHYPDVANLGDMRLITRAILTGIAKAPDVLVGGTPCQAFSLAGLREALDDDRGQLTLTYMRLLDAIDFIRERNGQPPCIAVWENVPGVLSTKDNAFGCFLAGLAGEEVPLVPPGKKWANAGFVLGPKRAVAWRTMDAQYLGLAQQRKRVFVVASARKGFDPSAVLFEWDGMRRDSAPSREPQTHVAALTANGVGTCGADDNQAQAGHLIASTGDISHCLNAGGMGRIDYETETFVTHTITSSVERPRGDGCDTLIPLRIHGENSNAMKGDVANVADAVEIARCLDTQGGYSHNQGGNVVLQDVECFTDTRGDNRGSGVQVTGDIANTLHCAKGISEQQGVAYREQCVTGDIAHCLKAEGFDASEDGTGRGQPIVPYVFDPLQVTSSHNRSNPAPERCHTIPAVATPPTLYGNGLRVRRLMPVECERLQGFPDGYTLVPHRGKDAADGPRYKAIGNSMAVPVMAFIGLRLKQYLNNELGRGFL